MCSDLRSTLSLSLFLYINNYHYKFKIIVIIVFSGKIYKKILIVLLYQSQRIYRIYIYEYNQNIFVNFSQENLFSIFINMILNL